MSKAQYSTLLMLMLSLAVASRAQAFFRIGQSGTRTALLRPDGSAIRLRASDHIRLAPAGTDLSPAEVDTHVAQILGTLERGGFNAIGAASDPALWHRGLPYIETLDLARQLAAEQQANVVDVYARNFRRQVDDLVEVAVRPRLHDRTLIGYLSDQGLPWEPNRDPGRLLAGYLTLPWTGRNEGREHAVDYLRQQYGSSIAALRRAWHIDASGFASLQPPGKPDAAFGRDAAGFARQVLARYLSTVAASVHGKDPHHLFLGANLTFAPAARLGSIWSIADVASLRLRAGQDPAAIVAALRKMTSRPLLVEMANCTQALSAPGVIGTSCGR